MAYSNLANDLLVFVDREASSTRRALALAVIGDEHQLRRLSTWLSFCKVARTVVRWDGGGRLCISVTRTRRQSAFQSTRVTNAQHVTNLVLLVSVCAVTLRPRTEPRCP